jgi:transcriptional regulator GlxA family with amidase domain
MEIKAMSAAVQAADITPTAWYVPRDAPAPASQTVTLGVRRAEALILTQPERPFTVNSLARAVGLSTRSLSRGFQRLRGYGPMAAVRRARLDRVRLDLLTAAPHESVTNVAMRWGFYHLGRFSGLYAAHFGELPSATRRYARPHSRPSQPQAPYRGPLPFFAAQQPEELA